MLNDVYNIVSVYLIRNKCYGLMNNEHGINTTYMLDYGVLPLPSGVPDINFHTLNYNVLT